MVELSWREGGVQKPSASALSDAVQAYTEGKSHFDFPIDWQEMVGTPFQKKVWRAMTKLSFGETTTYGELARRCGSPGGARAVGTACGKNPVLLAIPCHRVLAASGLGGFSGGGLSVKRRLLELESVEY